MTVGSPTLSSGPHAGLEYECMTKSSRGAIINDFPKQPCPVGIFVTHHFPASVPNSLDLNTYEFVIY
jgi:hypothetical protein